MVQHRAPRTQRREADGDQTWRILISMSTPAGRSRRWSESTVLAVWSTMSKRRLCTRISKCSRESLCLCGRRTTVYRCFSVGSGTGPCTRAFVRSTVWTIFAVDWSRTPWSKAFSRIRIICRLSAMTYLLQDLDDATGTDRAATFADGEGETLFHGDRLTQRDGHLGVVPRHEHLGARGQLDGAGDVGRAEVELRTGVR